MFEQYESLLIEINSVFEQMKEQYPDEVHCAKGCVDCCNACYDISFIEAAYISYHYHKKAETEPQWQETILTRAQEAEQIMTQRLARLPPTTSEQELLDKMAIWRLRCPLLGDDNSCQLYEARPVTCRVYGLPTAIGGRGHVCGFSGFSQGSSYPTVYLDRIFSHLHSFSSQQAEALPQNNSNRSLRRYFVYDVFDLNFPWCNN